MDTFLEFTRKIRRSQLSISASTRPNPHGHAIAPRLHGFQETLPARAEADGVVIWTGDLFKAAKALNEDNKATMLESIKCATGRWRFSG